MSTRFYSGQKDYIVQLNLMEDEFQEAVGALDDALGTVTGKANKSGDTFTGAVYVTPGGSGTPSLGLNQVGDNPYVEWQRWMGAASNYQGFRLKGLVNGLTWEASNQTTKGAQTWTTVLTLTPAGALTLVGGLSAASISTTGSAAVGTNLTVAGSLTVGGSVTVNGTTTTVNSTTVTVDDPIITLGGDTAPTIDDNKDRGVEFRWHNGIQAKTGFFGFDDSTGKWTFIPDATNTNEVFTGTAGTLVANLEGNVTGNVTGTVSGNAGSATVLQTARTINGVSFNGSANITVKAATPNLLTAGSYLTGSNFDGSGAVTWNVDATSANTASKVVARDASGNFSAGTITATLSGNATTATTLQTARTINGVSFNGSANITVTANNPNSVTFNNGGAGAASGTAYNGGSAITVSYNTVGAPSTTGTNASGTWDISITGNAATVTNGVYTTGTQTIGGTKTFSGYTTFSITSALNLPVGTTAQRPAGAAGDIRLNSTTGQFEGHNGSNWGSIGGGAKGGGADQVFYENDQVVTTSYTITAGKNAMTVGPLTMNSGATVTVPSGSRLVIL